MPKPLKAGSVHDLGASMAAEIEAAMQREWQAARGQPLPGGAGELDRQILFAAIAQGVLRYLYAHRTDLLTNRVHDDINGGHVHHSDFDLLEKP